MEPTILLLPQFIEAHFSRLSCMPPQNRFYYCILYIQRCAKVRPPFLYFISKHIKHKPAPNQQKPANTSISSLSKEKHVYPFLCVVRTRVKLACGWPVRVCYDMTSPCNREKDWNSNKAFQAAEKSVFCGREFLPLTCALRFLTLQNVYVDKNLQNTKAKRENPKTNNRHYRCPSGQMVQI